MLKAFKKNPNERTMISNSKIDINSQYEQIYKMKLMINLEFKEKIQRIQNQTNKFVKEKSCMERFFDFPPLELVQASSDDITFFKGKIYALYHSLKKHKIDPNMNYDDIMLYGIDWDLFIWNIVVFQFWIIVLSNYKFDVFALSVVLTYLIDKALMITKSFFGERNLSRKAMIDNKFFI